MQVHLEGMVTEARNPRSAHIDTVPTLDMVRIINEEDQLVALAVEKTLGPIAAAIDCIAPRMEGGGRLVYIGAGTSGRLGVLDASECPPTYGVSYDCVVGLIAGGLSALVQASENAEDRADVGEADLRAIGFCKQDCLVGIAASGRTPYVIGAMQYAKSIGAPVISLCCNPDAEMVSIADIAITPVVGPEVVTGSTRMKAGTAQKMVLNMISTGVMIRLGKVYGNLMVDMRASNEKLMARARRIVAQAADTTEDKAAQAIDLCAGQVKVAILHLLTGMAPDAAREALDRAGGRIGDAIRR